MNKLKLLSKLAMTGTMSAIVGGIAVQQDAVAGQIGLGRVDIETNRPIEFTSNAVNFTTVGNDVYGLGAVEAGEFDITVLSGAFEDREEPHPDLGLEVGDIGLIYDLVPSIPPGGFSTAPILNSAFPRPSRNPGGDLLLRFGDSNVEFQDAGIEYYYTSVTRTSEEVAGAFTVNFTFEGYFRDTFGGRFDNTPSVISLFTAATDVDPEVIFSNPSTPGDTVQDVINNFNADNPGLPFNLAGTNGLITTPEKSVPEPGTVLGLLAIGGLGLGLKKKKQS